MKDANSASMGNDKNAAQLTVVFTDLLLDSLSQRIANREPERGAVLLGIGNLATIAVEDSHGGYSASHWDISSEVIELCDELQRANCGFYVGQVHSHPTGVRFPSQADQQLMFRTLEQNTHRELLMMPIISQGKASPDEIQLTSTHVMTTMAAVRQLSGTVMRKARFRVIRIGAHLRAAGLPIPTVSCGTTGGEQSEVSLRVITLNGVQYLGIPISLTRILLLTERYPENPPLLLDVFASEDKADLKLSPLCSWDSSEPVQHLKLLSEKTPRSLERLERVEPILGKIHGRVLIAGAGSVGSTIADDLARSGVDSFTILDPDRVSAPNIARSIYKLSDIGLSKVDALANHLTSIDPSIVVEGVKSELGRLDLREVLTNVDLVIGATDDMEQQFDLAATAYHLGIPMVSCALYRMAEAGEVILTLPAARSACLRCTIRDWDPAVRPDKNYGVGGRLEAEPGLGPSIKTVASYASLMALGIISGPESRLGRQLAELIGTDRIYGKIATVPRWGFFPEVLGTPLHQHAPQSVWIRVARDTSCIVCGDNPSSPYEQEDIQEIRSYIAELNNWGE